MHLRWNPIFHKGASSQPENPEDLRVESWLSLRNGGSSSFEYGDFEVFGKVGGVLLTAKVVQNIDPSSLEASNLLRSL